MKRSRVCIVRMDGRDLFLPPRSFVEAYSLLVEHVYLLRLEPQESPHKMRRRGTTIPVRNYRAYQKLRRTDGKLRDMAREIYDFLDNTSPNFYQSEQNQKSLPKLGI